MSQTLEAYLDADYHLDTNDVREVEIVLDLAAKVFVGVGATGVWPYEIRRGHSPQTDSISHGTQSMILAALGKMTGSCSLSSGHREVINLSSRQEINVAFKTGLERLLASIRGKGGITSGSFGDNDPITLSHIAELLRGLHRTADASCKTGTGLDELDRGSSQKLRDFVSECAAVKILVKRCSEGLDEDAGAGAGDPERNLIPNLPEGSRYSENAFVPLRIVRALTGLRDAGVDSCKAPINPGFRRFFESRLHEQLSFSMIPDSRFDPAELIFCLEGLFICAPKAVDDQLFRRVLEVLELKQKENAHWRPARPMYATPQGMTMLPVSVEGAVSLLHSVALIDGRDAFQTYSSHAAPMMRRFWRWLRARMVQFEDWTGWHSEHVNDPRLIQLWDTSQVIEFLLGYRHLLQRSMAGRTLLMSRLTVNRAASPLTEDWNEQWKKTVDKFEPVLEGDAESLVYDRIGRDFILPWARRTPKNYSMLLYGPPGTGKSTLAENIANVLGMRMVTVTVSDFLGGGGASVEARAKAIFQTLEAQSDTVILFDEIDNFLLDRDSQFYQEQDTLFKFLTPGMLTKINDLRKTKRSIFIIATNYANRIDPAIKRTGRIDKQYLLSLPNRKRRAKIISELTSDGIHLTDDLAVASLYFGFTDIVGAVQDAGGTSASEIAIRDAFRKAQPATSLESYLHRFAEDRFPFDELREIAALATEVGQGQALEVAGKAACSENWPKFFERYSEANGRG